MTGSSRLLPGDCQRLGKRGAVCGAAGRRRVSRGQPQPKAVPKTLPAGRGRKSSHGQGGDEPTAEPPANRVEVDAKRMVNEPVQRQVTIKTSVIHHGDVGNHNMLYARK